MRLVRLGVRDFGCVGRAEITFERGLNVLYGPNDLGKSTLAAAIRSALLLQPGSSGARPYVPWSGDRQPEVELELEVDGRVWKVEKRFSGGPGSPGGFARLSWSNDGRTFTAAHEGRAVDGELRTLLQWGIAQPGGRGGKHGLPRSFLASVLLGEQAVPYRIFESSLADDADDGGKVRLTEALAALATDPLYQDVLIAAQARVDEAFTAKGRKRQTKASPFTRVANEIKLRRAAAEDLDRKVSESDAVAARLGELDTHRDRRMAALATAREALAEAEATHAQVAACAKLSAELDAVREELAATGRNKAEIVKLGVELAVLVAREPAELAALETAHEDRTEAAVAAARAVESIAQERAGGNVQGQLEREKLETAVRTARARVADATKHCDALTFWQDAERDQRAAVAAHDAAEAERAAQEEVVAGLGALRSQLDAALAWKRTADASEAAVAAAANVAKSLELRGRAAALRDEAAVELGALEARGLPADVVLKTWHDAADALALAKARAAGGLRIRTQLAADIEAHVLLDGGVATPAPADGTLQAVGHASVELGALGRIELHAGSAQALAELDSLTQGWEQNIAPAIAKLGVQTLPEAAELAAGAGAEQQAAHAKAEEARTLDRMTADHDEKVAAAAQTQVFLDELRGAAVVADEAAASSLVAGRTQNELDEVLRAAQGELAQARAVYAERVAARNTARVALELAGERTKNAREALGVTADEGSAPALLEGASASAAAALVGKTDDLAKLEAELASHAADWAGRASRLASAADSADAHATETVAAAAALESGLRELRDALAAGQAALKVRREQAHRTDAFALAEAFAKLSDQLAALPAPTLEIGAGDLEARQDQVRGAEQDVDDASSEVRKQEGALQQVGGQVVREKAEAAREALDAAQRREAEVELDYDGWQLLLDTLREAENEEGAHLGRALAGEVAERFGQLTKGRYGGLDLGPELQARGLTTGTGTRPLERFSEGIKEQLATILRVSVAEHLDGALLLDDHLAQTDPARAGWFRDLLLGAAERIQIIVLTCREGDYLAGARDGIRALDLTTQIERR